MACRYTNGYVDLYSGLWSASGVKKHKAIPALSVLWVRMATAVLACCFTVVQPAYATLLLRHPEALGQTALRQQDYIEPCLALPRESSSVLVSGRSKENLTVEKPWAGTACLSSKSGVRSPEIAQPELVERGTLQMLSPHPATLWDRGPPFRPSVVTR